jgi:hypothetical protein
MELNGIAHIQLTVADVERSIAFLSAATQQAFATAAKRVGLHTATDDHPNATPNYQARGYRVCKERELKNPMPSRVAPAS